MPRQSWALVFLSNEQRAEAWRVDMKVASKPEHEIALSFPGPFLLSDMLRGGDLAGSRYL